MSSKSLPSTARAYLLVLVNAIVLLATLYLIRPTSLSPWDPFSILQYYKIIMVNIIIYIVLSLLHIVVSHAILGDLFLTYLNRIAVLLHVLPVLNLPNEYLLIDLGLLLSIPIISRILGFSVSVNKTSLIVKNISSKSRFRKPLVAYLSLMLSSHSMGVALYQLTLFLMTGGDLNIMEKNIFYFVVIAIIIPMALLTLSIVYPSIDIEAQSALSGFGLLGLSAFLTLIQTSHGEIPKTHTKALYLTGPGIMLGEALYVTSYDYPSEVCISTANNVQGKTWCWRRIYHPLFLRLEELNTPHIVIIGASGSGKTTLAKRIVYESSRKYGFNVIIVDQHGEYRDLADQLKARIIDASQYIINPLSLEGSSPRERTLQLAHIISQYFRLGFKQRQLLEDVILRAYYKKGIRQEDPSTWSLEPPLIDDLVNTCKELAEEIHEYHRIMPYLTLLQQSLGAGSYVNPGDVLTGSTIIDLSKVYDDFTRVLYIDTIIYLMINYMYKRRLPSRIQVVFEEAREIIPREVSRDLLSRLFAESRKFGFSVLVITQELHRVPRALINNAGLRIFFVLNEPEEIEEASRILAGSEMREKARLVSETIRTLDPYVFIVHATGSSEIYMVKTSTNAEKTPMIP